MAIHDGLYTNDFAPFGFHNIDQFEQQARFAAMACGLAPGQRILDLACGWGRHSLVWAGDGYDVTGIDNSVDFLERARASASQAGLNVRFERQDMRALDYKETFEAVLSMSASLAFYDDATNLNIIRRVRDSLKPGGLFYFDQPSVFWIAPSLSKQNAPRTQTLSDGRTKTSRHSFDARTLIASNRSVIESDGRRLEAGWDIRCYTLPEMQAVYRQAELVLERVYGDADGSDYSLASKRMITLARRPA